MSETLDLAAMERAAALLDKLMPQAMTIVKHEHMMRGAAWKMLDGDHIYYFMHPADLDAIPRIKPTSAIGWEGVPVREFDDEMREVFIRCLGRLADTEKGG